MRTDYGVRHPTGSVSVRIDGHPFGSRAAAEAELARFEAGDEFGPECVYCDKAGPHSVVSRSVGEWE